MSLSLTAELGSVNEVFSLDDLGTDVFKRSYAFDENETWKEASDRVATHVAKAEEYGESEWASRFYSEIVSNRFMPGGRIWYGAGREKAQLLNCFVISPDEFDSAEGWGELLKESVIISSTGGGIGINFSPIRPNGTPIKGKGGHATGPVSLMRMDNGVGLELVGGGGRRMAKMSCLNINHPDIAEFLDSKLVDGDLSTTNISVVLNFDPEEFKELVKNDGFMNLEFEGKSYGITRARVIWDRIVSNAWNNGEPGVLNQYYANKQNNIHYYKELVSTNPCGEIWLEPYGCCCLGAIVLPRFVKDGEIDWEQLDETVRIAVRFLDNVLTVNQYPLEKIKENCFDVRRIGLGVMGLHTMLLELGIKYSEGFDVVDKVMEFIKISAYNASIDLAVEKGAFPAYSEEFLDSGFMKTMPQEIRDEIYRWGIRNCAILTVAPTGTTGIVSSVTTGIEPLMAAGYWRTIKMVDARLKTVLKKVFVVEPAYEKYGDLVEGAIDISVEDHFRMQQTVQPHVDNAVSKTINLPNNYPMENLSKVWLDNLATLKGTTFYRFGSRENEPFQIVRVEDIPIILGETPEDQIMRKERNENEADCVSGICFV